MVIIYGVTLFSYVYSLSQDSGVVEESWRYKRGKQWPRPGSRLPGLGHCLPRLCWFNYSGGSQSPGILVGELAVVERIQANPHGLELEVGHALIDLQRNIIDTGGQTLAGLEKIARTEGLVGKAEVHYRRRTGLGSGLADQASLGKKVKRLAVG